MLPKNRLLVRLGFPPNLSFFLHKSKSEIKLLKMFHKIYCKNSDNTFLIHFKVKLNILGIILKGDLWPFQLFTQKIYHMVPKMTQNGCDRDTPIDMICMQTPIWPISNGPFWDLRIPSLLYRFMWPISVTIILDQNFWGPPRIWKISKVKTWYFCLLGNKVQKVQLVHSNQNGQNYNPESVGTKLEIFIIFAVLCHFWT